MAKGRQFIFSASGCKEYPRPTDRNMPTQHIVTLLGATCCVRLATVLWCVATCWVLLAQIWPASNLSQQHATCRNRVAKRAQHVALNVAIVWPGLDEIGQIWANNTQHVATRWPNARNMLCPTMLRYVVLACCDRLAGALHFSSLLILPIEIIAFAGNVVKTTVLYNHFVMLHDHCIIFIEKSRYFSLHCLKTHLFLMKKDDWKNLQNYS